MIAMGAATSIYYDDSMADAHADRDLDAAPESATRSRRSAADEARLRGIVDAHFAFVWRALRGLGVSASSADDAAQQVFMVASRKLAAIERGSERAFLAATARGIAANLRRSSMLAHEISDEQQLHREVDGGRDPEQQAAHSQALRALEQILLSLDEELRVVFVFFELEGMTMAEIASGLDLPMGTVASRLRRAREELDAAAKRMRAGGGRR